jgi:hypothetical protein
LDFANDIALGIALNVECREIPKYFTGFLGGLDFDGYLIFQLTKDFQRNVCPLGGLRDRLVGVLDVGYSVQPKRPHGLV